MRRMLLVVCVLAGCPGDPPPACIAPDLIDTSCAPGYVPTFTNVYNNTLRQGCGSTKSSCHSASGKAGDLSFESQAVAHTQLLDATEGRVKPGDPMCSEMIVRTSSPGEDYQMPPGDPLSEPARCALVHWVLDGALP